MVPELPLESASPIAACSLAGAYLLLHHASGDLTLAMIDATTQSLTLVPAPAAVQVAFSPFYRSVRDKQLF